MRLGHAIDAGGEPDIARIVALERCRPGDARDRDTDVGTEDDTDPLGHRQRHLLAHRRHVGAPEERELERTVIGCDPAAEHVARAGDTGEASPDEAARERLRHRKGLAPIPEQLQHDRLHGVVVGAENDLVADDLADDALLVGKDLGDLLLGVGLGGDPDLQTLPARGKKGDGGATDLVEPTDLLVELLGQTGLALAPRPQGPALDHAGEAGP